jgi:DNA-directed RNA polymerase alpha subunit
MNTALFNSAEPSLQSVVEEWFNKNRMILGSDEEVVVSVITRPRPSNVKVVLGGVLESDLDEILKQSFEILEKTLPKGAPSTRILNALNNANKLTIREVVSMSEAEFLKYRHVSRGSLNVLKKALSDLDHRLYLGMRFDRLSS